MILPEFDICYTDIVLDSNLNQMYNEQSQKLNINSLSLSNFLFAYYMYIIAAKNWPLNASFLFMLSIYFSYLLFVSTILDFFFCIRFG